MSHPISTQESLTLPLSYAVIAHGEEIDCLILRHPTTADVIDLGQPMRLLPGNGMEEPAVEVRMNVVAHYVARLAAIPLSSVKALSLGDFGRATQAVLGFFGEDTAPPDRVSNSPSASSKSPGSSRLPRATS
ncbi:phage tail assembly protein [Xanthomonas albilineans]|uniref:phage tail assembly protein n=1 Tax=Xanthomonas albilineans TaxID=29447 RepID=UPI000696DCFF|nr:phage tail assembly protein [Xanthomonas albilineans]